MGQRSFYSIWAMPELDSPLAGRVAALIQELSSQYGTPPFEPHVTVLGGFGEPQGLDEEEVVARTQALADRLAPYPCRVADVARGSTYFQSVYLTMVKTEQVMNANSATRLRFGIDPNSKADYMPHMSLLYGDLDAAVRDQIVQEVKAQHADLLVDSEFLVRSFHLYRTDPSDLLMKTWTKIAEFPLQGRQEKAGAT